MKVIPTHEIPRLSPEAFRAIDKLPLVLILDNIRSAANVGSFFRTADAFALDHLYLGGITAQPPHRDILKTALGASETVTWTHVSDTPAEVQKLQQKGYRVLAVEIAEGATPLPDFSVDPEQALALVFGNEVIGVSPEIMGLVDGAIEIPQFGTKHSLNVSISAGIVIWEVVRQLLFGEGKAF
ncbi:MAG: RNA methyltransferase [Bacteroidota bacterium]